MVSPQPDVDQDLVRRQTIFTDYNRFLHTSTLAACVLAPVLIILPPRKLDLYTFFLSGAFIASVDYQARERAGLGIMGYASRRFMSREQPRSMGQDGANLVLESSRLLEESSPRLVQSSSLQHKAQEDWKQQRLKEEQEKLDRGEGYWSMIVEQVWHVWNQEEKKVEQLKERDEEVVQARKERG
ncbi:hypothetical protein G647_07417 [Cladophialophora carrionii CBS 160.54]|uniref:Uncharacterized protein n=1 Tax=Cladophialophora carrionii CBS 160.54 TaxID=1279043 RepID=V9D460_9EURO|nr:uncharacterized protein G647_07417 [Cladophialophora carrionii CBS 160.54]ETI21073.1 hypothetical protein G647_07417 [Cladophialophora carrionii CBS 160.54]